MFLFWGMVLVDLGGIRGTTDDYDQNTLYGVLKEFIHYCFFLDGIHCIVLTVLGLNVLVSNS